MSARKQEGTRQKNERHNLMLYVVAGVLLVLAGTVIAVRQAHAGVHPKPRAEAEQVHTEDPADFGADVGTKEAYTMAAQIKSTLDGIFCYCYCKGAGHYSLLDCFRDDHGAGCDICKDEARLAYRMIQEGATLEQIRLAIDAQFGQGS